MSTYPGNSSLGDEVKRRILGTYEQSVELAERGRNQEAILGCDFVLELDPQFAPARALRDRLSGGDGHPGEPHGEPPARLVLEEADDLFDLDSFGSEDLPDLEAPAPPATVAGGLAARLRERLGERDFRGVLEEAGREREAVAADPELARIAEIAQARLEAQPYVEGFLREAGTATRAGDLDRADTVLEKARSLDPDHPLLEGLEANARRARAGAGPGTEDAGTASPPPRPAAPAPAGGLPDDLDLLDGFELPEVSAPEIPGWEDDAATRRPAQAADADLDDDLLSFDAPELEPPAAPPPAAPAAAPSTSGGAAPAEGDHRISELLAEGQRALEAGDYQGAIDAWSRLFLIDVDHEEAARRIEDARRRKAERERAVEEVFHEGLSALEAGGAETARGHFERVLEMQPNHLAARDYLRQIESGEPVKVRRGPSPDETVAMGSLGTFDLSDLAGSREKAAGDALREEILVPPPPSDGKTPASPATSGLPGYGKGTSAKREPGRRTFVLVGGLVLALVVAVALWLFANKEQFFPNSDAEEAAAGAPAAGETEEATGTIERATGLHERGQTAMALGLLKRIRPDDPRYEEAQELIARWEAPSPAAEEAGEAIPPEALAREERLLKAAESAYERREYLLASELYGRAGQIAPLGEAAEKNRQAIERLLQPLSEEIELFELGEYEMLLPKLWRLYEEEPSNRDVRRMLVDSYYNRGVRELQRGNAADAADEFEEALAVDPDDPELQRHFLFAQTYERRSKDLLYRIYVKYLPVR
jgi:tetratricopeptide (TPR) repeat protein